MTQQETQAVGLIGQSLYDQEILPHLDSDSKGKFLVLDVNTGDYEIDAEDLAASERLLIRHPDAMLYGVRIGSPTAYKLGGKFLKKP
jgi:hypothetical protein